MTPPLPYLIAGGAAAIAFVGATTDELLSTDKPFGWFGAILLSLVSALVLWRAGTARAWKETADAREARIADLERMLAELHAELNIPQRLEGLVRIVGETSAAQDRAATERLDMALERLDSRFLEWNTAAARRSQMLLDAIERTRYRGPTPQTAQEGHHE